MLTALAARIRELLNGSNDPTLRTAGLGTIIDGLITSQVEFPGRKAVNVLRVAANVASQETVTVGADVYEVNIVNTDTNVNVSGGELAVGTPAISQVTIAAHGLSVGDLIRVENEIMKVMGVVSANKVTVKRGHSGTAIATHADATDIFKAGTAAAAGRLEVGLVTTLTPAAFGAALVAVMNSEGTAGVTGTAISNNEVLIVANAVGDVTTACAEALAGANNAWAAANMYGGKAAGQRRVSVQRRVPNAAEVALGNMHFVFDFVPVMVTARVIVTATPGIAKDWDGTVTITGTRVVLHNIGGTDFAATDTVELVVTD